MLMFGLLAWVITGSLVGTQLSSALLRRPLTVDIFNLTPLRTHRPPEPDALLLVRGRYHDQLALRRPFFEDFLTVPNLIVYSVVGDGDGASSSSSTCGTPTGCWPR
ncbi:MAG: hypothetical protein R3A10_15820 [Caldilineaceae bacterium]